MGLLGRSFGKGDGLLVVDVQIDFCPGGALHIAEGDRVVPILNEWIQAAGAKRIPIYASRGYHPQRHISFKEQGGPWPPHCIQDTAGAKFHPALHLPDSTVIITKGVRFDQHQNSAFDQTGLAVQLRRDEIERLIIEGLALDVCVLATVLDALNAGFSVVVIEDGTRPVTPDGGKEALARIKAAGAVIL
jgi:nicotinamidase/pyrazinamidase